VGELMAAQKQTVGLASGGEHGGKARQLDGVRVTPSNPRPTLAEAGIDKELAKTARKLAAVPSEQFETLLDDWRDRVQAPTVRVSTQVHFSSASPEHYTPREILDAVVACLGQIDLDPCSNGGRNVPAMRHFTSVENGLDQPWQGTVYMNPPYGREIDAWVTKLCAEHARPGGVTEAIALVPARTDTQWFLKLRDYVCCFVTGRLTFVGNDDPAPFPSALFYLGEDEGKFCRCFEAFGDVWQRTNPELFGE
jgi:hypothetical protein